MTDRISTPEQRLAEIRRAKAERQRQRAELAEARRHGLVRRHAAKLAYLRGRR